jgi:Zn-dependent peptidase ImmA (M78 family)
MEVLLKEFEKRNIKVVFQELNFWAGLLIFSENQKRWVCLVNSLNPPSKQRWTLAHELAHFLLHPNFRYIFTDGIFFCGLNDMEWQANRLAGEMLIPKNCLQDLETIGLSKDLTEIRKKILLKSQEIGIPFQALAWWLSERGMISFKRFQKLVSKTQNDSILSQGF